MKKKAGRGGEDKSESYQYFLYLRDLLLERKFISSTIYDFWVKQNTNTIEEMEQSTKVTINLENLEAYVKELSSQNNQNTKAFILLGDLSVYAKITYAIMMTLKEKRFFHEVGSTTTMKKYAKVIENLGRTLYNSSWTPPDQKALLKEDKKIKYMILKILEKYGVYEVKGKNKLSFSEVRIENLVRDFTSYSKEEFFQILTDDISVIYSDSNQSASS